MIEKEYIADFKKTKIFDLIKKGIIKNQIESMLLGEGEYELSFLPITSSTDPSLIIIGLHILIGEELVSNHDINKTFNNITITSKTVCILLDYIKSYLLYKNIDNILNFEFSELLEKITANKEKYAGLLCYENLLREIFELMK